MSKEEIITICYECKSIKKNGEYIKLEEYFKDINFSHGLCPECFKNHKHCDPFNFHFN